MAAQGCAATQHGHDQRWQRKLASHAGTDAPVALQSPANRCCVCARWLLSLCLSCQSDEDTDEDEDDAAFERYKQERIAFVQNSLSVHTCADLVATDGCGCAIPTRAHVGVPTCCSPHDCICTPLHCFFLCSLNPSHSPRFGAHTRVSKLEFANIVKSVHDLVFVVCHLYQNVSRCSRAARLHCTHDRGTAGQSRAEQRPSTVRAGTIIGRQCTSSRCFSLTRPYIFVVVFLPLVVSEHRGVRSSQLCSGGPRPSVPACSLLPPAQPGGHGALQGRWPADAAGLQGRQDGHLGRAMHGRAAQAFQRPRRRKAVAGVRRFNAHAHARALRAPLLHD